MTDLFLTRQKRIICTDRALFANVLFLHSWWFRFASLPAGTFMPQQSEPAYYIKY